MFSGSAAAAKSKSENIRVIIFAVYERSRKPLLAAHCYLLNMKREYKIEVLKKGVEKELKNRYNHFHAQ